MHTLRRRTPAKRFALRVGGLALGAWVAPLASAGCTNASSNVEGGRPMEAGADARGSDAAVVDAAIDARGGDSSVDDASLLDAAAGDTGVDAATDAGVDASPPPVVYLTLPAPCIDGGANAGSRWQDLYACYFGSTTGVASCAGTDTNCHASTSSDGYLASQNFGGGYVCPPGDAGACWMSITSALIQDAGSNPPSTTLYQVLRTSPNGACGGYLCMPLSPDTLIFAPDDMARIASWIAAGAKNN